MFRRLSGGTGDLVKTTSMRMTLHLLPARDFQMYIAAMKASSMASVRRTLKRIGAARSTWTR